MRTLNRAVPLLICAALGACGKSKTKTSGAAPQAPAPDAGAATTEAPEANPLPELGVDQIRRFNYPYGDGAAAFAKAAAAYKAKTRDWAGVRAGSEAALAKDASHLEAHRLLAAALAQDGDYTGAAEHVLAAMAADYTAYGAALLADPDLAGLMASPTGAKLKETAEAVKGAFLRKAAGGLLLVGRRSTFKLPDKPGAQFGTSRGELYAYDRESKRYLRLSQTEHQVAGFARSSTGKIVLVGFDKIVQPADESGKAVDKAQAPTVGRGYAWVLDGTTFEREGKRITLPAARQLVVGFGVGERLLAVAIQEGSWRAPINAQWLSPDPSTGKTAKTQQATLEVSVAISPLEGELWATTAGVTVAPAEGSTVSEIITASGAKLEIPDASAALRSSLSLSPDGAHVMFAAAPDPCVATPSLFMAEAATGALKHVLTGKSSFVSRWLDSATVAYDDPDGAVRLYDASTGREALRLTERGGLGLAYLATTRGPACERAEPADDPVPPEEP